MGKVKDKNLNEILKRSTAEKLVLVESLWENIREEIIASPADEKEINLVKERYMEYKKNPELSKKWEDIKKNYVKKK